MSPNNKVRHKFLHVADRFWHAVPSATALRSPLRAILAAARPMRAVTSSGLNRLHTVLDTLLQYSPWTCPSRHRCPLLADFRRIVMSANDPLQTFPDRLSQLFNRRRGVADNEVPKVTFESQDVFHHRYAFKLAKGMTVV